jgi:hypothetical protein
MTVAVERVRALGATTPRIFTPANPEHCGADGMPSREWSWGYDCADFLEKWVGWKLLPWQRWLYIHALEKGSDGAGFRWQTIVVLVARQQGKTQWLKGLGLWRLFANEHGIVSRECPGARMAVLAAQNLDYAESTLKEVVDEIRNNPRLRPELINHRVTNGKHRVDLTNRRYWRAAAATRRGGRSLAVDIVMLDELREHTSWDAWEALVATTTVRPHSQVVCTSNAGDERSEVLRTLRDGAIRRITTGETADSRIGLYEWSVPMEVDPADEQYWYLANPAMGQLNSFTLDDLRGYLEAQQFRNLSGFQTEHLCQWVAAMEPGIIPAEHWQETMDFGSRRAPDAPVYVGVDVNYGRTRAYVGVAAPRTDGSIHVEVIAGAGGTDWLIDWLVARKGRFAGIAVQKTGAPASGMVPDMLAAGLPITVLPTGLELQSACGLLYDGICEHRVFHRPAPVLDRAAASGIARTAGDAWVFDRRNSPVDVAPLISVAAALWLQSYIVDTLNPVCHVWPEEEVIEQWRRQAEGTVDLDAR